MFSDSCVPSQRDNRAFRFHFSFFVPRVESYPLLLFASLNSLLLPGRLAEHPTPSLALPPSNEDGLSFRAPVFSILFFPGPFIMAATPRPVK